MQRPRYRHGKAIASEATGKERARRGMAAHAATVLALGIGSQLSQVLLVREVLTVFHGNELTIGIALAGWLFWVGLGSRAGAWIARRTHRPLVPAAYTVAALAVVLPGTLLLLRTIRRFFGGIPGIWLSFTDTMLAAVPALAPACLLWGAQFVFLARLWRDHPAARGMRSGRNTYILEATGNSIGGLVFSLWLAQRVNPFACMALAALLPAAALAALAPPRSRLRPFLWILAAGYAATIPLLGPVDAWAHRLHWRLLAPDRHLIETRPSRYGLIAVTRLGRQYGFYQSSQLAFSTGTAGTDSPAFEEQEAAGLAHLAMAQHPDPRTVLLIGGGLRGTLRELARHPLERIDYIELDPVLVETALPRLPAETRAALADPRVRLRTADGRAAVKTGTRRYDVILVDAPDPSTAVLNRFYTREFFAEARARLRPNGLFVIGATSTAGLRDTAAANRNATIYHTLSAVFTQVLPIGDRSLLFFATDVATPLVTDPRVLRERHRLRGIDAPGFSDRVFFTLLQDAPLRRIHWILQRHGRDPASAFAPPQTGPLFPDPIADQVRDAASLPPVYAPFFINSDFRPIGYFHTLVFWSRHARGGSDRLLPALLRVRPGWLGPILALPLLAALVLRLAGRGIRTGTGARFALAVAVVTTGLATMASQVAILFAFQGQYGYVYHMIGAIVAVFMIGLALGAALLRPERPVFGALAWLQLGIAGWAVLMAAGLPAAARLPAPRAIAAVYLALTFFAGIWNGMNFPLALACARGQPGSAERRLGRVYSMELIGACIGAWLAGTVVIPVLGIPACFLMAAALNATACAVILILRG